VLQRLQRIPSAKARQLLTKSADDFGDFVRRCAQTLQAARIKATTLEMYGKQAIRIDPGEIWQDPIWLNLDFLYDERKRPDFDEFLLERIRFLFANR
jgi:hypothetical protein